MTMNRWINRAGGWAVAAALLPTVAAAQTTAVSVTGDAADYQARQFLAPFDQPAPFNTAFRGSDTELEYGATGTGSNGPTEDRVIYQFDLDELGVEFQTLASAQLRLVFASNPDLNNSTQTDLYGSRENRTSTLEATDADAPDEFDAPSYVRLVEDFVPLVGPDGELALDTAFTLDVTSFIAERLFDYRRSRELDSVVLFRVQVQNQSANRIRFYSADATNPAFRPTLTITGTPVPEPAAGTLLLAGGAALLIRRRRGAGMRGNPKTV